MVSSHSSTELQLLKSGIALSINGGLLRLQQRGKKKVSLMEARMPDGDELVKKQEIRKENETNEKKKRPRIDWGKLSF